MTEIYLNHRYIGDVDDWKDFASNINSEIKKGSLSDQINISYNEEMDSLVILTTKGRARRPLVVVKNGEPLITEQHIKQLNKKEINWEDLVKQGVIEYVDASQEENSLVALEIEDVTSEHTHLEVTPLGMLALTTSLVPYANFSPPARMNVGQKNQKQAIGLYAANYLIRMDTDVNLLHTPQIPIVRTVMHEVFDYHRHPFGQNVILAILDYDGYNMDDALVVNKSSVERGLARSTYFKPTTAQELRYAGGLMDEVCMPDKDVKGYRTEEDYRLLEDDGIISPESFVKEGDVVIGKTSPPRFLSGADEYNLTGSIRRESSLVMPHGGRGVVDFVLVSENSEGNKLIQVRLRDQRIPEIGDKLTSRHGQKGVIGVLVPQSNMPFTASGVIPDLLFSPHGMPSRMTISHLLEMVGGKVGSLNARYVDGTTFAGEEERDLRQELQDLGFREDGTETMYNGQSGKQYKAKIFIGNIHYFKLKHMVANKLHSRARGPVQLLTRQPTEGRAKEGGLRLGEMEKDTFVAHGTSLLLKERFDSDKAVVPVCEECGVIAIHNEYKNKSYCPMCGDNVEINNIEISYAFKLMLDEFKALGIFPKVSLKNKY